MGAPFSGRIGIIQRVLADYRRPFFERLAALPSTEVSVFAGQPLDNEGVVTADVLSGVHLWPAKNLYWPPTHWSICWQLGIFQWLRTFDPDALIIGANPRLLSSRFAIKWMKHRQKLAVGWGLGELPRSGPRLFRWARHVYSQRFIRRFDGLLAYSSKAAQDYCKMGVPENRLFVVHNAIDNDESSKFLSKFGSDQSWQLQWKRGLHMEPDLPVLLFAGRLLPQKKVEMLIRACIPLLGQCQILIVGDGPWKSRLEDYGSPYRRYIRFAGHQSGEMLAKSFIAADIFILPGWGGLALHQAMSYGKPVIVSFGDGTEVDLVEDEVNGLFFRPGDEGDLRNKIHGLLMKRDRLAAMGQISLDIIRNKMSLDAMVGSCHRALGELSALCQGSRHQWMQR